MVQYLKLLWLDLTASHMWKTHPDLNPERDCVVLTFEDIDELKWLDYEIAIEHTQGAHVNGCPIGCALRGR